jgi:hypothetical protein
VEVTRRARALGAALIVVAVSPSIAWGDEPTKGGATPSKEAMEEARTHYARGVKLYGEGSFGAALVELDRANELAPSYKILYSVALVQLALSDFAGAKGAFERYLAEGGVEVAPARKAEVERRLIEIAGKIAIVTLTVSEADAAVLVDDIAIGKSPLGHAIALNPGFHKLAASKSGFTSEAKQVGCAGGDTLTIDLPLTPIAVVPVPVPAAPVVSAPPPVVVPVAPPPPAPVAPPRSSSLWMGWTATGVLAAGAIVTGIAALDQSKKLTNEIDQQPANAGDIHATHERTVTLALVSDLLSGSAVVAGAATLYFTLIDKPRDATSARVVIGPGRVGLVGRF